MMEKISIPVINTSVNPLPVYATTGAAGMDVYAALEESVSLNSLERVLIPTGIAVAIPEGYEIQVRPRSGLAAKHGITVLNAPGTIDADYRGEIKVILVNLSAEKQVINPGERIAQLILAKVEQINWQLTTELSETSRNTGGFGHTGKQ